MQKHAGLSFRLIPDSMKSGNEPMLFGGKPQLPPELEWPHKTGALPYYFLAQIDLAKLPREVDGIKLPNFPLTGFIFIFICERETGQHVLYHDGDVSDFPERAPPSGMLPFQHAPVDATTDSGTCLIRKVAEVLPFAFEDTGEPKVLQDDNGEEYETKNFYLMVALQAALDQAQSFPPAPLVQNAGQPQGNPEMKVANGIPPRVRGSGIRGEAAFLEWEFIGDWAQGFIDECDSLTRNHLKEMQNSAEIKGLSRFFLNRLVKRTERNLRASASEQDHSVTSGNVQVDPLPVSAAFDAQAGQWLAMAKGRSGTPPKDLQIAFVEMMKEVEAHFLSRGTNGGSLGLRIERFDKLIRDHGITAETTLLMAKNAFETARRDTSKRSKATGELATFGDLSQQQRWDWRIIHQGKRVADMPYCDRALPLMMFGPGFKTDGEDPEFAYDLVLLDFQTDLGLPSTGSEGEFAAKIRISADDLALGNFSAAKSEFTTYFENGYH